MKHKNLESLRAALTKLVRDELRKDDGGNRFFVACINESLGNTRMISERNVWYGDAYDPDKEQRVGQCTLFLPLAQMFNSQDIKTKEQLENTILDDTNWRVANYALDFGDYVVTRKNTQTDSVDDYYDYLKSRRVIG